MGTTEPRPAPPAEPAAGSSSPPTLAQGGFAPPVWRHDNGTPVSCVEKIKVLNENYAELQQMTQDAFEDALLLGCSEEQVRVVLRRLIDGLYNPYPGAAGDKADC